jgi:mannose-6-phosphate isomerase-like protein (cupin superfamily)
MEIIARDAVAPVQAPDGAIVRELASPQNSGLTRHSLAEITHPAGTTSEAHYHRQAEEVYYVLSGRGGVRIDGQTQSIGPSDTVVILPGQRHQVWQEGDTDLVLLVTCVPAYSLDDVVSAPEA